MIADPYKVLGISRDASDEQIKKAYRKLSRKFHPDANINNPNKDQTEKKFKEIQEAYEQIIKEKQSGGTSGYGYNQNNGTSSGYGDFREFGGFGFGGFGNFYGGFGREQQGTGSQYATYLNAATNYINSGHYQEALNVLNQMEERTARWYYLSAIANLRMGNNITASEHARYAAQLEPDNIQYRQLVNQMESGAKWYGDMGTTYGTPASGYGSMCCKCLAVNLLCNCCCNGGMMYC